MPDEFAAKLGETTNLSLEKIISTLCQTHRYTVENATISEAALRFASKPRQSSWPEDFTVSIDGEDFLLTVYGATKAEREQLIRDTESALHDHGVEVSLDEI